MSAQRSSKLWFSTESSDHNEDGKNDEVEEYDDLLGEKSEAAMQPQGVNPGKGWQFRGVHKVFDTSLQLRYTIVGYGVVVSLKIEWLHVI